MHSSLPCIFVFTALACILSTSTAVSHLLCTYNISLASFKFIQLTQKGSSPVFYLSHYREDGFLDSDRQDLLISLVGLASL